VTKAGNVRGRDPGRRNPAVKPRRALLGYGGSSRSEPTNVGSAGGSRLRRHLPVALTAVVVLGILALGIGPARMHLEREGEVRAAEAELERLTGLVESNAAQIEALDTDAELERVARRDFRLARPGEEIYQVLPAPLDPSVIPPGWPFPGRAPRDDLP
jgi:cell division protein FtsB